MLYDPKWEVQITTKPSLDGLIAWLEMQDPEGKYNWGNCDGECLIHLYLISCGITDRRGWLDHYFVVQGWNGMKAPASGSIALGHPHTFGAALKRARKVKAGQS